MAYATAKVTSGTEEDRKDLMDEQRVALIEQTRQFWQPRTSRLLTQEDARQMVANVTGFFATLQEWAATERMSTEVKETVAA